MSERYLAGMREHSLATCWRLLDVGLSACILERGHDGGLHEQEQPPPQPEPTPDLSYQSPEALYNRGFCPTQPIWELVIADMQERNRIGTERYGTPLRAFNGGDALTRAYEEALDLAVYLRQAIEERDHA